MNHTITTIAEETGVSHSTVKRAIKKLGQIGTSQGNGKARLFSDEEYQAILSELPIKAVEPEVIEPETLQTEVVEPKGMMEISNGFYAQNAMTYQGRDFSELATHLQDEVHQSGVNTAQEIQNLFGGLSQADQQLGAAIGAKRLQNILGTADQVVTQGLRDYAETQGLGKSQKDS